MRGRSLVAVGAVVLVAALAFFWFLYGRVDNADHAAGLRALVNEVPDWGRAREQDAEIWEELREFYESRDYLPAWIDRTTPTPRAVALLDALQDADSHGLNPADYGVDALARRIEEARRFDAGEVPAVDARLTYAYLRYAADLSGRSGDPQSIRPEWSRAPHEDGLAARLAYAAGSGDIAGTLEELAPRHPQYDRLRRALAESRDPDERTRLALNLERWRWSPRDLGERHILVNVPAYSLQVIDGNQEVLAMRVVVGSAEDETPIFSDLMTYVVFSPYWNIPSSILRDETVPRVIEDPGYLERSGIEVLPPKGDEPLDPDSIDWDDPERVAGLRFRQVPGPENALGLVKFIFPNHFAVYLHDTPANHLFAETERAFSHGCIRVEQPVALAEYVLGDRGEWTPERIEEAMHADEETTVKLRTPIPVHIGYWTAWVGDDGTVHYTSDPYEIDAAHARMRGLPLGSPEPAAAAPSGARTE